MNVNQAKRVVELATTCQAAQAAYLLQCVKDPYHFSLPDLNDAWDESMKVFMDYTFNLVDE